MVDFYSEHLGECSVCHRDRMGFDNWYIVGNMLSLLTYASLTVEDISVVEALNPYIVKSEMWGKIPVGSVVFNVSPSRHWALSAMSKSNMFFSKLLKGVFVSQMMGCDTNVFPVFAASLDISGQIIIIATSYNQKSPNFGCAFWVLGFIPGYFREI